MSDHECSRRDGDLPRWATIHEVARHIRVSSRTVQNLTGEGSLRRYGRPHQYRWDLNEVDEWVRNGTRSTKKLAD